MAFRQRLRPCESLRCQPDGVRGHSYVVIAEQMGHSDGGAFVLRRYGHLDKGAHRHAATALEAHVLG